MDGYDVLRTLKADPATRDIPVFVVSVSAFVRPPALPGFIAHLRKPFDVSRLPAMLSLVQS